MKAITIAIITYYYYYYYYYCYYHYYYYCYYHRYNLHAAQVVRIPDPFRDKI